MKGIIVVDIPECCKYCPFVTNRIDGNYYCSIIESTTVSQKLSNPITDDEFYSKPDWCPIKCIEDIKNYKNYTLLVDEHFRGGWNSCIDAITGKK